MSAGRVDECIGLIAPVDGQLPDRPSPLTMVAKFCKRERNVQNRSRKKWPALPKPASQENRLAAHRQLPLDFALRLRFGVRKGSPGALKFCPGVPIRIS